MQNYNIIKLSKKELSDNSLAMYFSGNLNSDTISKIWDQAIKIANDHRWEILIVDISKIDKLDGAGISLLVYLKTIQTKKKQNFTIHGISNDLNKLLNLYDTKELLKNDNKILHKKFPEIIGRLSIQFINDIKDLLAFVGELFVSLIVSFLNPKKIHWKDVFLVSEKMGVDALPIISLIGFLLGLIMAFEMSVTLKQFGAEIFVANMVGVAMFRELGPLVTAIVVAGRSGSSFAAELGTMKINEEIDALKTMGLNPINFLAVSRVLGAVFVTPLLSIYFCFVSLIGGAVVMLLSGFPLHAYASRVFMSLSMAGFLGGVIKAAIFSLLISGIGCQRGLTTKTGASAVGQSTTSAVVSGLVLITFADGIFAVIYYYLGL